MKKIHLFLLMFVAQTSLFAQKYFPEGTKWTEIRLDTLKYDTWYSRQGDEWIPNFETVEYWVKGEYVWQSEVTDACQMFKCVYTNGTDSADSLALLIRKHENGEVRVTVPAFIYNEIVPVYNGAVPVPGAAYGFDNWRVGLTMEYQSIVGANIPSNPPYGVGCYGTIEEIKEGYFGGTRPLKYVDVDKGRIIHGIGVTEWDDGECLFGPVFPYGAYWFFQESTEDHWVERHYRSMLVHFERDGEVLYDVWPDKTDGIKNVGQTHPEISVSQPSTYYDLSGRRITQPTKGIYIRQGRKVVK